MLEILKSLPIWVALFALVAPSDFVLGVDERLVAEMQDIYGRIFNPGQDQERLTYDQAIELIHQSEHLFVDQIPDETGNIHKWLELAELLELDSSIGHCDAIWLARFSSLLHFNQPHSETTVQLLATLKEREKTICLEQLGDHIDIEIAAETPIGLALNDLAPIVNTAFMNHRSPLRDREMTPRKWRALSRGFVRWLDLRSGFPFERDPGQTIEEVLMAVRVNFEQNLIPTCNALHADAYVSSYTHFILLAEQGDLTWENTPLNIIEWYYAWHMCRVFLNWEHMIENIFMVGRYQRDRLMFAVESTEGPERQLLVATFDRYLRAVNELLDEPLPD